MAHRLGTTALVITLQLTRATTIRDYCENFSASDKAFVLDGFYRAQRCLKNPRCLILPALLFFLKSAAVLNIL